MRRAVFHEGADQQQQHVDGQQEGPGVVDGAEHPVGHRLRDVLVGQQPGHDLRAAEHDTHDRGGAPGAHQGLSHVAQRELAVDEQADNSAYSTAMAEHSVTLKTPVRMPAISTGIISAQIARGSCAPSLASAGAGMHRVVAPARDDHQRRERHRHAYIRPGTMPARNSLVIDRFVSTPISTKVIDGGMIGPTTFAAAVSAAAKPRSNSRP
jgi:hypothetical protein